MTMFLATLTGYAGNDDDHYLINAKSKAEATGLLIAQIVAHNIRPPIHEDNSWEYIVSSATHGDIFGYIEEFKLPKPNEVLLT
jgi:hypothetical protein